jgi:homoserine kinase
MEPAQSLAAAHRIVVPASISNLGPGFDALSVAVQLYLQVEIIDVLPSSPGTMDFEFVGCQVTGDNRIASAFDRARDTFGEAPGVRVRVRSDIPMRAGLGSSASALVAGLRLYESVTTPRRTSDWLRLGAALEGHPDNAAAALLGGLTVSCQHDDGRVTSRAAPWPSDVRMVVATPHLEVETGYARSVLPESIPRRDAVFNLQRALLLVRALESGEYGDLREALRDRWHQAFRAPLVPGLAEALMLQHPALLGTCLSGSGPSIVAFTVDGEAQVVELLDGVYRGLGVPCTIRRLEAHQPGSSVTPDPSGQAVSRSG